jgi:hypothetical protein
MSGAGENVAFGVNMLDLAELYNFGLAKDFESEIILGVGSGGGGTESNQKNAAKGAGTCEFSLGPKPE